MRMKIMKEKCDVDAKQELEQQSNILLKRRKLQSNEQCNKLQKDNTNLHDAAREHGELMQWLTDNKLLKAKQQFIGWDVSMDDLKSIDFQNDVM